MTLTFKHFWFNVILLSSVHLVIVCINKVPYIILVVSLDVLVDLVFDVLVDFFRRSDEIAKFFVVFWYVLHERQKFQRVTVGILDGTDFQNVGKF